MNSKKRIAFIHGRPAAHPKNVLLAKSLNADFYFVDYKLRYSDLPNTGRPRRYFSWLLFVFSFPLSKYDVILTEGLHIPPVIMKMLGLFNKKQKLIALIMAEELYFIYTKFYSPFTMFFATNSLKKFDSFICKGQMQIDLAKLLFPQIKTFKIVNGISTEKQKVLNNTQPSLELYNVITVANGTNGFRIHYKGLDLMLSVLNSYYKTNNKITFTIIGSWDSDVITHLLNTYCDENFRKKVNFVGEINDFKLIGNYLTDSSLFLLTSRGDCFPNSTIESMAAGLPTMVSEWTGTKEFVESVDKNFVTKIELNDILNKISWYFNLSIEDKRKFSEKCRKIIANYPEEKTVELFHEVFTKACEI